MYLYKWDEMKYILIHFHDFQQGVLLDIYWEVFWYILDIYNTVLLGICWLVFCYIFNIYDTGCSFGYILGNIVKYFQCFQHGVLLGIYWEMIHSTPPLSQLPSLYLHARLPSQDGLGSHKQNNNSSGLYAAFILGLTVDLDWQIMVLFKVSVL